ncbi:MAG TPA: endonuclease domain-containing protein [Dehalococcoidia bacterium]|nr:endonuclease domain-containing protein [Dehalococcoidia bacterium]
MRKNRDLANLARELRHKQTDAERALWARVRNRQLEGVKFRRQQPIGPYIVDFVSLDRKLVIEIDGGHHSEEELRESDQKKSAWLEERGYEVLRFWNNEVMRNMEGVLEKMREALG